MGMVRPGDEPLENNAEVEIIDVSDYSTQKTNIDPKFLIPNLTVLKKFNEFSIDARLNICLIVATIFSLIVFSIGWNNPLIDRHAFRQTQTAISTYWMIKEGHYLAYQTPVLGYPWSIPFEFPMFQWVTAFVYKVTNFGLDQCGRFISILFFYLTFIPLFCMFKLLKCNRSSIKIFFVLFLFSPVYLYYSSAFMIESMSLFLSVAYLFFAQLFLEKFYWRSKILPFCACIIFGSLGILVKVTTFVPFCLLCAGLIIFDWHKKNALNINIIVIKQYLLTILFALIPLIALIIWTDYADSIKNLNSLGQHITSSALYEWNFGSPGQWFSWKFIDRLLGRSVPLAIGWSIPIYAVLSVKYFNERTAKYALFFFIVFLSGNFIFTNLHMVHDYYGYENSIFLIISVTILLTILLEKRPLKYFWCCFLITLVLQLEQFTTRYLFDALYPKHHIDYNVGRFIDNNTNKKSFIIVYGKDWSSTISYYSKRKSLTDPLWGDYKKRLENIKQLSGGLPLSAIVLFPSKIDNDKEMQAMIHRISTGFSEKDIGICKILYSPIAKLSFEDNIILNEYPGMEL